jgi:hypothetical protein
MARRMSRPLDRWWLHNQVGPLEGVTPPVILTSDSRRRGVSPAHEHSRTTPRRGFSVSPLLISTCRSSLSSVDQKAPRSP